MSRRFHSSRQRYSSTHLKSRQKTSDTFPLAKGDIFTARVKALASDGRGITEHDSGVTVFVPGLWLNESAQVRIVDIQKRSAVAEVIDIIECSPNRIQPICPHHGFGNNDCGGCSWQFISYEAQLNAKQHRVEQEISRLFDNATIRKKQLPDILPIWPSSNTEGYRNRAQLKSDGRNIGYMAFNSGDLAPIAQCPILSTHNQQTLQQLRAKLPNQNWAPRKTKKPLKSTKPLVTLHIDETLSADEVKPNQRLPFRQANTAQNKKMQHWLVKNIVEFFGNEKKPNILELFCGSGNFTESLASIANSIVAADSFEPAIDNLKNKQFDGVTAVCENLYAETVFDTLWTNHAYDLLVLDPPREGLKNKNGLVSKKRHFKAVFYISCNLATFCRDAEWLLRNNYQLQLVQPLDQTPHTPHIELLATFTR